MYPANGESPCFDPLIHSSFDRHGAAELHHHRRERQIEENNRDQPQHYLSGTLLRGKATPMSEKIRTTCIGTRSRSFSSRLRPWFLACMDIRLYQGFGAGTAYVIADQYGKSEAGGEG